MVSSRAYACLLIGVSSCFGAEVGNEPPLPIEREHVVVVKQVAELQRAVESAANNTTILIADGTYRLNRLLYLRAKQQITICSESRDPTKVTLQGLGWDSESDQDDILRIGDCRDILVAHMTLADCHAYGIKVQAEDRPRNIHIYNCRFRDIGTRAIKGSGGQGSAQTGSIRWCQFENTKVPPAHWLFEGNYITAIDMMALDGWTISDNRFRNIKGRTGGGRAAIFVWVRSQNVTVERNWIVDCDRGIALGNPSASSSEVADDEFHVRGSVCRNNFIVPGPDAGIELWWVQDVQVLHNTIWRREESGRGIRFGARTKDVLIANNLVRGAILDEGSGPEHRVRLANNLVGALDGYFVNPAAGDLHLTAAASGARDAALPLPDVRGDFDGQSREGRPDIGADELVVHP
jgi:hypothetical protein